ncbi:hypothetical protein SAMN05444503_11397 [Pseudomonas sp. BS3767]|nr:hypothetical protein SAMN05444503_11397 [Pseudomonas sp. BS3767]SDO66976.1 hypothetical protein SAMN05444502_11597 [Pseudomonas sp. BS3759]
MPTTTCSNEECGQDIEFDLSALDVENSESSGSHTTQYSGSGTIECQNCGSETEISYVWDVLDDTGEVLSIDML